MHTFFESTQDNIKEIFTKSGSYFEYPAHLHQKIEVFILLSGKYDVRLNGSSLQIKGGDILFIDSYVIHSYSHIINENDGIIIIIPPSVAEKFFTRKGTKKISNPHISDPILCNTIYDIAKKHITPPTIENIVKNGAAELILALLEPKLQFTTSNNNENSNSNTLVQSILTYIAHNLKDDINLNALSKKFGYSTVHISRVFNNVIQMSLTDYINEQRLYYIETAIKNGKKENITSLIFDAGFKSIQTYYRAKNKRKFKQLNKTE